MLLSIFPAEFDPQLAQDYPDVVAQARSIEAALHGNEALLTPSDQPRNVEQFSGIGLVVVRNLFTEAAVHELAEYMEPHFEENDRVYQTASDINVSQNPDAPLLARVLATATDPQSNRLQGVLGANRYHTTEITPHADVRARWPVTLIGVHPGVLEIDPVGLQGTVIRNDDNTYTDAFYEFNRKSAASQTIVLPYGTSDAGSDLVIFDGRKRMHRGKALDNTQQVARTTYVFWQRDRR